MTLPIIYISILAISFLCSLISFRLHYPFRLKLFSILLGVALLTEICANYLLSFFHLKSNLGIYNVYVLIQDCIYCFYFLLTVKNKIVKKIISIFIPIYIAYWGYTSFLIFGINVWNSYAIMIGDTFIISLCVVLFFEFITSENILSIKRNADFWIMVGSFIFFSSELPIVGMFNFMTNNYQLDALLLEQVLQILNILMYTIFIYAFLCRTMKTHIMK